MSPSPRYRAPLCFLSSLRFLTKSDPLTIAYIHIAVSLLQLPTKPNLSLSLTYVPSLRRLFFAPFHHPVFLHIMPSSFSSAGDSFLFSQHFLTLLHKVTRPLNFLNMKQISPNLSHYTSAFPTKCINCVTYRLH